jgi:hypothetical protein
MQVIARQPNVTDDREKYAKILTAEFEHGQVSVTERMRRIAEYEALAATTRMRFTR